MFVSQTKRSPGLRQVAGRSRLLCVEPLEDRRLLSASRAAEAINQFAYDVYEHMQHSEGNLFYSPLSVATALAMAYAGAAGQTAAEMQDVLHLGSEPGIHSSFSDLLSVFETQTSTIENFDLEVANAMWPGIGWALESGFVDIVEGDYSGYAEGLDFSNPELAEDIINDWVEDQTHGKIEDLVDGLDENTVMVLTNALYFKGLWQHQFDPRYTSEAGWFYLREEDLESDDYYVETPMMLTQADVYRTSIGGFSVLDMPFQGGASSMVFIVPSNWSMPNRLSASVIESINDWFEGPREVSFSDDILLPKFELTVSTGFNQLLAGLGMSTAFSPGADFSSMVEGGGIFIDKVFHKATLTLNEQGTEAAAATEIEFAVCFAAGTPVMTPEGEKRIEDLQAGDYVLARDEHNLEGPVEPRMVERLLHGEANIVQVYVGGQEIRTTALHPFFVRGKGWTPAGEIKAEDRISTNHGDWIEVEKVWVTEKSEDVYNLRVAGHRTYFVGSAAWKFGVWVHNDYGSFEANRPFHFFIRDNETSTISFMGRIDDPTQLTNNVNPSVASSPGDFDGDGDVDGRDFLFWQRGNSPSALSGGDLADWQAGYGAPLGLGQVVASDSSRSSPVNANATDEESREAAIALAWSRGSVTGKTAAPLIEMATFLDNDIDTSGVTEGQANAVAPAMAVADRLVVDRDVESANVDSWLSNELLERVFS